MHIDFDRTRHDVREGRIPMLRGAHALLMTLALSMALCLPRTAGAADAVAKGPYVTGLSDSSATLRFELGAARPARVEVTAVTGTAKARVFESPEPAAMHVVEATGLEPSTEYRYVVRAGAAELGSALFTTAPKPGAEARVTFTVYGDTRTDPVAHEAVIRGMRQVPSDFLVNTGDLVERGGRAQDWQTFFDIERPLLQERPVFVAVGNHELYDDAAGANYGRYFGIAAPTEDARPLLYGTVRLGNVRLFFLNAMDEFVWGDERHWFERELGKAASEPGVVWRVVVLHHGPWSHGPHGPNTRLIEAGVPELLERGGVDLVVSGHDHVYERGASGAIKYVVSGGGGAPLGRDPEGGSTTERIEASYHFVLFRAGPAALQMTAQRADGSVIESCELAKGRAWDCGVADAGSMGPPRHESDRDVPSSSSPTRRPTAIAFFGLAFSALAVVTLRRNRRRAHP
jgi:hypothetical protein